MDINSTDEYSYTTILFLMENSTINPSTTGLTLSLQTYTERVAVAFFFLLISVTNIVGNSMVILAVVFSNKLRTSTNVFVVSLSVADLTAGLAASMSIVALLSHGDSWPWFTEAPCSIAGLLLYINSSASLFNLASIALNRLILIKWPMTLYRSLYTKRNIAINVVVLWIVAIAIMAVPPLFGIGGFGYDQQHHTCSDLDTHPKAKTFERIQTFASFPISLVIIVTSYILIFMHVRRHFKTQRAIVLADSVVPGVSSSTTTVVEMSDNADVLMSTHRDRIKHHQLEITKNLFMAVCAFFICIGPYGVVLFIPNNDRYLLFVGVLFFCNSCVNPIIYAAKHPQFKKVLRSMLRCNYSQIEEPSDTLKALMSFRKF